MGHSSKKKKKRGGGAGRRAQSKDHHSIAAADSEILAEELTALCAIFQEDCKIVSESPPQVNIKLRPYSKDTGYEDSDVSALLSVRCVQGYPFRCPKLQIVPERGLSKTDTDNLLSLLYDQPYTEIAVMSSTDIAHYHVIESHRSEEKTISLI
ncbi:eIF-2-alpha kinase GCN2 [Sesamum angolense]|uniref:EIF-2-alpha kinase GCN2 n=1 Tax=Sesamum angolense TaxID=2727404 RepID=A0AAE1X2J2_9LAMI|nr:eIF-2-alpha kinase GCN2 [Sesamum angolense]